MRVGGEEREEERNRGREGRKKKSVTCTADAVRADGWTLANDGETHGAHRYAHILLIERTISFLSLIIL